MNFQQQIIVPVGSSLRSLSVGSEVLKFDLGTERENEKRDITVSGVGVAVEYGIIHQMISDLRDTRVTLSVPVPVRLEYWGESVTAYNADCEQFGYGNSEQEALDMFCDCVVELYLFLKSEGKSKLGPVPRRHWNYLNRIIIPT